jgi:hypothetical protein
MSTSSKLTPTTSELDALYPARVPRRPTPWCSSRSATSLLHRHCWFQRHDPYAFDLLQLPRIPEVFGPRSKGISQANFDATPTAALHGDEGHPPTSGDVTTIHQGMKTSTTKDLEILVVSRYDLLRHTSLQSYICSCKNFWGHTTEQNWLPRA